MRCPLDFEGLNNGSAGGEAPAVGNTANQGHVSLVNKIGSTSAELVLTSPEGRNPIGGFMTKHIAFKDVPVGAMFIHNGNACTKLSTRTALLMQYMRKFYFKQDDIVEVPA
jgi:hypothetical protein